MDPVFISLVSACTALVASIVGPMVTLSVAKRQINASVLSANRQRWIESLRDLVAELISLMDRQGLQRNPGGRIARCGRGGRHRGNHAAFAGNPQARMGAREIGHLGS
jgi:hypothetical protein